MLKIFNSFVDTIRKDGMIYFKDNTEELKIWINKLEFLNTVKSSSECKHIYYILLELLATIEDEEENDNIDSDIYSIERKFFDWVGIVRERLMN